MSGKKPSMKGSKVGSKVASKKGSSGPRGGSGGKAPKRQRKMRHDPLDVQMRKAEDTGKLKIRREQKKADGGESKRAMSEDEDEEEEQTFMTEKMSRKVLAQAAAQQEEDKSQSSAVARTLARMHGAGPAWGGAGLKAPSAAAFAFSFDDDTEDKKQPEISLSAAVATEGDEDVSEEEFSDEEDVDVEVDPEDEKALEMFMPKSGAVRRTLADLIMDKIRDGEQQQQQADAAAPPAGGNIKFTINSGAASGVSSQQSQEELRKRLPRQVVEAYTKVGKALHYYSSGRIPKAFKIIPSLKNWEEILFLTEPEQWSSQAMFVACRLFSSNLNEKMAQRFYNLVLLPRLREDISRHKKLNFHLYQAVKKAMYKPVAFFRGLLLPLVEEGCTARESIIISSLLSKCSLPVLHSSVALLRMAQLPYSGPTTLIMRTLLNKKYSLPYKVIDQLVKYFAAFSKDKRELPVVWHQNLLCFVQRYKTELTPKQRNALSNLIRAQHHKVMSEEIRRELLAPVPLSVEAQQASLAKQEQMKRMEL